MALDRVRPLKLEDPATGGTELDPVPNELDPNEDYTDVRGVVFQDDESNDETVYATRAGGNMMFHDQQYPSGLSLTDVAAGGFAVDRLLITTGGGLIYENAGVLVVKVAP